MNEPVALHSLYKAAKALVDSVHEDEAHHGGLLGRDTIRRADEASQILMRIEAASLPSIENKG